MKRWALVVPTALLCAAVAPSLPASASSTPTTVDLVSGTPGAADYTPDPDTQYSEDGATTWTDAISYDTNWTDIPSWGNEVTGATWVTPTSVSTPDETLLFRRTFQLPAGAVGSTVRVCYQADDAASVSVNGTQIGAQLDDPDLNIYNFSYGATCFDAPGTLLTPGGNTILFTVHNEGGPTGVAYDATVTYQQERVNTPPVLHLPADLSLDATGPQGAAVPFTATATDDTGATVACDHAPGSLFPIGTTTVNCTATDDDGATTSGSFSVHVRGAREQLEGLLTEVVGYRVGSAQTPVTQIRNLVENMPDRMLPLTCEPLRAFSTAASAMSGRQIPSATAAEWVADAKRIRAVLGCR